MLYFGRKGKKCNFFDKNSIVYFKKSSYLCSVKIRIFLISNKDIFRLVNKIVCV